MSTIPGIARAIRRVLTSVAEAAARQTGFVQRESKLTGPVFAQSLVFGWLEDPEASLGTLCQKAADLGVEITPQGLDDRFSPQAADFMEQLLDAAITDVVSADPVAIPLLARFSAVILQDSSVINLPDALAEKWQGCGDSMGHHAAALKIQVSLDVLNGTLHGPFLENGRTHDLASPSLDVPMPVGALRIADLGYFSLDVLEGLDNQGVFFLSRLHGQALVLDESAHRVDLPSLLESVGADQIDLAVLVGNVHRLPVRLLACRVPQEVADQRRRKLKEAARRRQHRVSKKQLALASWTVLITNVPASMLSLAEALVLARVRWQIELLFKLWKSHGRVDEWRTKNRWRILCEVYAKLTAMVIQHWILLTASWTYPDRSLVKAASTIRSHATLLLCAMSDVLPLSRAIKQIGRCLDVGCRMNRRKTAPNTYQLLLGHLNVA